MYHVYLLECADGTIYTGITTDVARRLKMHADGKGARYTKSRGVVKLLYSEKAKDRSMAQKREAEIKSWPRMKKLALTKTDPSI